MSELFEATPEGLADDGGAGGDGGVGGYVVCAGALSPWSGPEATMTSLGLQMMRGGRGSRRRSAGSTDGARIVERHSGLVMGGIIGTVKFHFDIAIERSTHTHIYIYIWMWVGRIYMMYMPIVCRWPCGSRAVGRWGITPYRRRRADGGREPPAACTCGRDTRGAAGVAQGELLPAAAVDVAAALSPAGHLS